MKHNLLLLSLLTLMYLSCSGSVSANDEPLIWLETIGAQQRLNSIHTIKSVAKVTVSDGTVYTASTLFHDAQRAIFKRQYSDHTETHGVEGKYIWAYDGKAETQAPAFINGFVLGHQIHAQILYFDQLHQSIETTKGVSFDGHKATALVSTDEQQTWSFYFDRNKQPLGMKLAIKGEKPITFAFSNWRPVDDISMPFTVDIDDGTRQFEYNYHQVEFNQGKLADFRAPDSQITDEQRLLRLHRVIMDDHFFGRTTGMAAFTGENVTIVSGGEVYPMKGKDSDAQMTRIMGNRNYTVYDDLIRPQVKVSEDGTLGWVIVQVSAKGIRLDPKGKPTEGLEFVSGWIELYQKDKGQWRMVGNVSNFR